MTSCILQERTSLIIKDREREVERGVCSGVVHLGNNSPPCRKGRTIELTAHLLLECRKWRREREAMVQKLKARDITVSETPDRRNLEILFRDNAIVEMLEFMEKTEVGKKPGTEHNKVDSWDVERLDQRDEDD